MTSGLNVLCLLTSVAFLPWCAHCQGFLGYNPVLSVAVAQRQIQDAVSEAFGKGQRVNSEQLRIINSTVAPMFAAMPKNYKGRIGVGMLRYAIQRYFGNVHNWIVRGFEPHVNVTEPGSAKILRSQLPQFAEAVIEKQLSHGGYALEDVVSAVAVVEQLILNEVLQAVYSSYALNGISSSKVLSAQNLRDVLHSFIIIDLLEGDPGNMTQHASDKANINDVYPNWNETTLFLDDLIGDDLYKHKASMNPFKGQVYYFEDVARVAQAFSQDFSLWVDHECKSMKATLVERDVFTTGRIRLADFYRASDDGSWQFLESSHYLRELGALDESSKELGPQVIISNYLTGMSNCIISTPFYAACCMNECLGLMNELETRVRMPMAPPALIVNAVAEMSSSTQVARNLTTDLLVLLDQVAELHNGKVPLHGRLLAQWMHYAFPRECPFPHVSGTVNPLTPGQYMQLNDGDEGVANQDEIDEHLKSHYAKGPASPEAGKSMWILKEELIETHLAPGRRSLAIREFLRTGVLITMIGCMVFFVSQHLSHIGTLITGGLKDAKETQYTV